MIGSCIIASFSAITHFQKWFSKVVDIIAVTSSSDALVDPNLQSHSSVSFLLKTIHAGVFTVVLSQAVRCRSTTFEKCLIILLNRWIIPSEHGLRWGPVPEIPQTQNFYPDPNAVLILTTCWSNRSQQGWTCFWKWSGDVDSNPFDRCSYIVLLHPSF